MGEATIWITFFIFCRMPPRSKKARFNDSCQTCEAVTTHVYRHVLRAHLPWYLSPATACVSCHMSAGTVKERSVLHGRHQWIAGEYFLQAWFLLMNGFFLFMSQELGLGSPIEMLGSALVRELLPGPLSFSEEEYFFLSEYDRRAGLEPLVLGGYLAIPPTRVIALSHPGFMAKLITHISPGAVSQLQTFARYLTSGFSNPTAGYPIMKRGIIEAHFHLDKLSRRPNQTLSDLEDSSSFPITIPFAIANYVFQGSWKYLGDHVIADPGLRITLGIHSHMITDPQVDICSLKKLVDQYPSAVGIGEVGLDFTTVCKHKYHDKTICRAQSIRGQRRFLRLSFNLAKSTGKVLVIHVRDKVKGSGVAAQEVLSLLLELEMQNHPIHRHCFIGREVEYRRWSSMLPNCYFSISPASLKHPETVSAIKAFDNLKRLLLETDSPYLADKPWNVNEVAEGAAQILDITKTVLVGACNKNVARLYNLPW